MAAESREPLEPLRRPLSIQKTGLEGEGLTFFPECSKIGLQNAAGRGRAKAAFPRLKRRGPIEADRFPIKDEEAEILFPRLKRRGPIEAKAKSLEPPSHTEFPRLKRRGPIEAKTFSLVASPIRLFPRLKRRGPIEARMSRGRATYAPSAFPRLKRRGPIEAYEAHGDYSLPHWDFHV